LPVSGFFQQGKEKSMPVVVQFDFEADHEQALDALFDLDALYSGAGRGRILVAESIAQALQARGIRCRILPERREEEPPDVTRP
jgi:hypothetical protein